MINSPKGERHTLLVNYKSNHLNYITFLSPPPPQFNSNEDFPMFVSMLDHKDLIFQDSTVRLVKVPDSKHDYKSYLETDFLRAMERMENIDCITAGAEGVRGGCGVMLGVMVVVGVLVALRHYLL